MVDLTSYVPAFELLISTFFSLLAQFLLIPPFCYFFMLIVLFGVIGIFMRLLSPLHDRW